MCIRDRYGPYTITALAHYTPAIRIATVGPAFGHPQVKELLNSLLRIHNPDDRPDYVPQYKGFEPIFRLKLKPAEPDAAHITWPGNLDLSLIHIFRDDQVGSLLVQVKVTDDEVTLWELESDGNRGATLLEVYWLAHVVHVGREA